MADDTRRQQFLLGQAKKPSNDNENQSSSTVECEESGRKAVYAPRVLCDLPDKVAVVVGEVELIEVFLFDEIGAIIANDNDR